MLTGCGTFIPLNSVPWPGPEAQKKKGHSILPAYKKKKKILENRRQEK